MNLHVLKHKWNRIQISFEKVSVKFKFNEKIINKIIEIKDCIMSKENIVLNQVLKNQEVE